MKAAALAIAASAFLLAAAPAAAGITHAPPDTHGLYAPDHHQCSGRAVTAGGAGPADRSRNPFRGKNLRYASFPEPACATIILLGLLFAVYRRFRR
jgi:hypothetical protein